MLHRRALLKSALVSTALLTIENKSVFAKPLLFSPRDVQLNEAIEGEDVFAYLQRTTGDFDLVRYKQILGAANPFKEGDQIVGVAAADEASRNIARRLLAATRVSQLDQHPPLEDQLFRLLQESIDRQAAAETAEMTLGELKRFLLHKSAAAIQTIMPGLSSDVIGCLVKLMTDAELIEVGRKIFNPLPGSQIGAEGYLGARVQPNSPTDNLSDIRWQVFDAWSYAVGDVVLGTNPVSSDPASVSAIERALQDLLVTFELTNVLPHCVLAHIDVQAAVENSAPGSTGIWFQSIAGSDAANATFDISTEKMLSYAEQRTGPYGLYFETGQGADFTNGHGRGFDMVLHESRKYGFARALKQRVAKTLSEAGRQPAPWVHLNDVAGFIGPEVFRTREQLVRCCLEDIVMGKLHGLCLGLDVCSTLHMDISLEDLDWCLDQILPANPAYLMALPTKIDPMLGYLTTGFQDHLRLREKFGYRVNDQMWKFFQDLEIIDSQGQPTEHFGDPRWVYLKYCRKKGDSRSETEIFQEGQEQIDAVRRRGVFIADGRGKDPWELAPGLRKEITQIYEDSKRCLWAEMSEQFISQVPAVVRCHTTSKDRNDYILHPATGEKLSDDTLAELKKLRLKRQTKYDVQIVVSDGLNALSITDSDHLLPFLTQVRSELERLDLSPAPEHMVFTSGRVRAGYQVGEVLFGGLEGNFAIVHVIGERPGTGHHTFSAYLTAASGDDWKTPRKIDHNITKLVSGIAVTTLPPKAAADEAAALVARLMG